MDTNSGRQNALPTRSLLKLGIKPGEAGSRSKYANQRAMLPPSRFYVVIELKKYSKLHVLPVRFIYQRFHFNCCNYKDHQSTQWFKFGDFSYADLVNKFKCPKCKVKQLPCSLDFVDCIYKIQAIPVMSSDKSININETTGKNKSVRYPCEGNTLYKSFTIETYELDE